MGGFGIYKTPKLRHCVGLALTRSDGGVGNATWLSLHFNIDDLLEGGDQKDHHLKK